MQILPRVDSLRRPSVDLNLRLLQGWNVEQICGGVSSKVAEVIGSVASHGVASAVRAPPKILTKINPAAHETLSAAIVELWDGLAERIVWIVRRRCGARISDRIDGTHARLMNLTLFASSCVHVEASLISSDLHVFKSAEPSAFPSCESRNIIRLTIRKVETLIEIVRLYLMSASEEPLRNNAGEESRGKRRQPESAVYITIKSNPYDAKISWRAVSQMATTAGFLIFRSMEMAKKRTRTSSVLPTRRKPYCFRISWSRIHGAGNMP